MASCCLGTQVEQCAWLAKCGWILSTDKPGVDAAEVAASLPSIEDIVDMCPCPNACVMSNWECHNLFVVVAYVLEKLSLHAEALRYATAALDNDLKHCGAISPCNRVCAFTVQGRAQAALGQMKPAAQSFESAIALAEKHGLRLLQALAIKDFKLCVLDSLGYGDHGARLLGSVLRLVVAPSRPAENLTPVLDGLDPSQLVRMPPPEEKDSIKAEIFDNQHAQQRLPLQEELGKLRLMELRQLAINEGLDAELIDDATENDHPKSALVNLLLQHHSSTVAGEEMPSLLHAVD